jgi:putative ABC transport system permease protein
MTLREILGRVSALWRRADLNREVAAELEAHIEFLARDLEAEGLAPAAALTEARRRVGNRTALRERSREAWGFPALEAVLQDLRYALRGLRRSPGFTATVIVTLALGIGANAAMFGVIDRLMFRPYPYTREPARLNRVYLQTTVRSRSTNTVFPYTRYLDLSTANSTIERFAAQSEWRFAAGTGEGTRVRRVTGVSASYFDLFDAVPVQGRWFTPAEDSTPIGTPVAVLSHALWTSEFGSQDVRGKRLKVGRLEYEIVGVAPPGFVGASPGGAPDIFVPITTIPANLDPKDPGAYLRDYNWDWTLVLARRKPGVSEEAASAELTAAYIRSRANARAINPRVMADSLVRPRALAGPVKQAAGPDAGLEARVLLWVSGVAAIVLLIASANVANLMFARMMRRKREVTVRLALGVSRGRLLAQFLTEGLLLAGLGCAGGLLLAQWGGLAIRALLLPDGSDFALFSDWRTLGIATACALVAAMLTTLGPALSAGRTDLASSLKAGVREGTGRRSRLRTALLVGQGALSVLLLVGATLFVRSLQNARAVPLGYDVRPVIEVLPDFRGFPMDSAAGTAMRRRLLAHAKGIPGVTGAARVNSRLFGTNTANLRVDGVDSVQSLGRFNMQMTTADFFDVMKTRITRGRGILETDREGAPLVAVVSEAMAAVLWPGKDPIGQCIRVTFGQGPTTVLPPCASVVGVAENTAQQNLGDDPRFAYYLSLDQFAPGAVSRILLRVTAPDARGELERIRREMSRAMPGDGFVVVRPVQEVVDDQSRSWRLGATLFTAFGGLALIVAAVGLCGVISYGVAQRAHELGVRVALGASAGNVIRLVVGQGTSVAMVGIVIGLSLAAVAARWVQPMLFRLSATDPVTYAVVAAVMLAAALAASAIPAFRASKADPNAALRSD